MIKSIKLFLTLFAVVGLLSACSSNSSKDDEEVAAVDETPAEEIAPVVEEPEPVDPLAGIDTVFYFDFDESILNAEARAALTVHAEVLKANSGSARIEGHADERGSREYNMALGERRANAVRDFLVLQGVDSSAIETVSYGEERPAEVGSYESSWARNRRAELK